MRKWMENYPLGALHEDSTQKVIQDHHGTLGLDGGAPPAAVRMSIRRPTVSRRPGAAEQVPRCWDGLA